MKPRMSKSTARLAPRSVRILLGGLAVAVSAVAVWFVVETKAQVIVYKSPTCECCGRWVAQLREEGVDIAVREVNDLAAVKRRLGVPAALGSCHTTTAGDYVLEGHVPLAAITRLRDEHPDLAGLAVAGMPAGAPGMESLSPEPYDVQAFGRDGRIFHYLRMDGFGVPMPGAKP